VPTARLIRLDDVPLVVWTPFTVEVSPVPKKDGVTEMEATELSTVAV